MNALDSGLSTFPEALGVILGAQLASRVLYRRLGPRRHVLLGLTAWLLRGFHVADFRAALLASLLVSVTGWIGSMFIGPRGRFEVYAHRRH